jgi:hypothetical protein
MSRCLEWDSKREMIEKVIFWKNVWLYRIGIILLTLQSVYKSKQCLVASTLMFRRFTNIFVCSIYLRKSLSFCRRQGFYLPRRKPWDPSKLSCLRNSKAGFTGDSTESLLLDMETRKRTLKLSLRICPRSQTKLVEWGGSGGAQERLTQSSSRLRPLIIASGTGMMGLETGQGWLYFSLLPIPRLFPTSNSNSASQTQKPKKQQTNTFRDEEIVLKVSQPPRFSPHVNEVELSWTSSSHSKKNKSVERRKLETLFFLLFFLPFSPRSEFY